jgi:hypothetical protein
MQKKITKTELKKFDQNSSIGDRFNDTEQKGFHARKCKTGTHLYYRYRLHGVRKTISLGRFPDLPIEKARTIISDYIGRIASGEDISETAAQHKQLTQNTGISYIQEIYDSELSKKGDGTNIRADLFNHFDSLLKKPMHSLTKRQLKNWQAKKEASGLKPKTELV